MKRQQNRYLYLWIILGIVVVRFGAVPVVEALIQESHVRIEASDVASTSHEMLVHSPFDDVTLTGASILVQDIVSGAILYEKNSTAELPLASLTKIMTGMVAQEVLTPETRIRLSPEVLATEGDQGLFIYEELTVEDLIDFMLVASSNDAARALGDAIEQATGETITDIMNRKAREIGLRTTRFLNETGLDVEEALEGGAYGSARDVGMLLEYVTETHPDLLVSTREQDLAILSSFGISHTAQNTNILVHDIPWLIGAKTGFTDLAGGNLAVVFDAGLNKPIVAVVLGSTREGRFEDMEVLVTTTFEYLEGVAF